MIICIPRRKFNSTWHWNTDECTYVEPTGCSESARCSNVRCDRDIWMQLIGMARAQHEAFVFTEYHAELNQLALKMFGSQEL